MNKTNVLVLCMSMMMVFFSSCKKDEIDPLKVTYSPLITSSSIRIQGADVALAMSAYKDLFSKNGFVCEIKDGKLFMGSCKQYEQSNVAVSDTAAVRKKLMQTALKEFSEYISNINACDMSARASFQQAVVHAEIEGDVKIGSEVLHFSNSVLLPKIESTMWITTDINSPIRGLVFGEGNNMSVTMPDGTPHLNLTYSRKGSVITEETLGITLGIIAYNKMKLHKYNNQTVDDYIFGR